ncbi:MAG TPA: cytochrome ubiquinol oxidase subunit I [Solirubrobacterales bacterium]|nr:cytochrome ubiquinol oxidase subunit I [Solirubrobacterales bacterium]
MPELAPLIADAGSNLLAARYQMAFTLGFHIVLACFGVAFPAVMLIAEYRGRKHGDEDALRLARRWSKAVAVLFAVGAVSGTVLSFEFGLLWPGMMDRFGDAFGMAFAIEGIFFFLEAIFIAIYIYGWKRLPGWAHFWSGVPIAISGIGGALSVIAANAWMNTPAGFTLGPDGRVEDTNLLDVLFNTSTFHEFVHMWVAAYLVAGFLVASVYAVAMLRGRRDRYHRLGFVIPFTVAAIAAPIQILVGDFVARDVYEDQPAKFAAMECVYETGPDQTEYLGGICTDGEVKGGIGLPGVDSLLAGFSTDTVVTGLNEIPPDERPPTPTTIHLAFDAMVGIGFALLALALWFAIAWWRNRNLPATRWFLRAAAAAGVAAVVALECGWMVTEIGRQPWIVHGFMRTEEAVTPAQGIWWVFAFTLVVYIGLGVVAGVVLRGMARRWRESEEAEPELEAPYSPPPPPPEPEAAP